MFLLASCLLKPERLLLFLPNEYRQKVLFLQIVTFKLYPFLFLRSTKIIEFVLLFRLVLKPLVGVPQGLTGPPDAAVLPSPPPCGCAYVCFTFSIGSQLFSLQAVIYKFTIEISARRISKNSQRTFFSAKIRKFRENFIRIDAQFDENGRKMANSC